MTRSDLTDKLAVEKGLKQHIAEQIVHEIFSYMSETLIADDRIEIRGFGSFVNREYEGRPGRNPKTGEIITVKSKKVPFFKTGKELRQRIMEV